MGPDGHFVPHEVPAGSPTNSSEFFYVKGMAAAAHALGDQAKLDEAREWFARIDEDARAERIAGDQQPLDPSNAAVQKVPGRCSHGSKMLGMGAAALLLECTGDPSYRDVGLAYLDSVLSRHVNTDGRVAEVQPHDMWEFVDADGQPWVEPDGVRLSDPGHGTETVGFALKFLLACQRAGGDAAVEPDRLAGYYSALLPMLEQNFANGFAPSGFGIVKAYDLAARKPLRTDMPWWSLPETLRAAMGACLVGDPADRTRYVEIAAKCSNAFFGKFIRPDLHLMAYQTIGADGEVIDTIPATPDADPGYHTGLSIIDYLDWMSELTN